MNIHQFSYKKSRTNNSEKNTMFIQQIRIVHIRERIHHDNTLAPNDFILANQKR